MRRGGEKKESENKRVNSHLAGDFQTRQQFVVKTLLAGLEIPRNGCHQKKVRNRNSKKGGLKRRTFQVFWVQSLTFWDHKMMTFGGFFMQKSMQKSTSRSGAEKVIVGIEKVNFWTPF